MWQSLMSPPVSLSRAGCLVRFLWLAPGLESQGGRPLLEGAWAGSLGSRRSGSEDSSGAGHVSYLGFASYRKPFKLSRGYLLPGG